FRLGSSMTATRAARYIVEQGRITEEEAGEDAKAMAKYPAKSLRKHGRTVYVVEQLWTAKSLVGGSAGDDRRDLLLSAVSKRDVDAGWIETNFHHELAHILKDQAGKDWPSKEWLEAGAPGWTYPMEAKGTD